MTSQSIFNIFNIAKDIDSLSSPDPISGNYNVFQKKPYDHIFDDKLN